LVAAARIEERPNEQRADQRSHEKILRKIRPLDRQDGRNDESRTSKQAVRIRTYRGLPFREARALLITFAGGYEDKNSPIFFIPNGHIKITAQLTPIEEDDYDFDIYLYKVENGMHLVWSGGTKEVGVYETYVYSLEAGDYFLEVSSIGLNWQITVQVYC